MGFTKKTWKNRIAEYINRRLLTNEDGSTELVTVARDEGTISQEGDAFNAANMNDLEDRIEAEFNEINQSLISYEDITFNNISLSGYVTTSLAIPIKNISKHIIGFTVLDTDNSWLPISINHIDDVNKKVYLFNPAKDAISGFLKVRFVLN